MVLLVVVSELVLVLVPLAVVTILDVAESVGDFALLRRGGRVRGDILVRDIAMDVEFGNGVNIFTL